MGKKFKITEEQYKQLMESSDVLKLTADTEATNGNVSKAASDTINNAIDNGVDPKKTDILITTPNESRVVTKKELYENRLKLLKRNSKLYTVKDFFKQ